MNVNLTPELENFVKAKVGTGRYNSASEVVRDALRLLEEQDRIKELKLQLLQGEVKRGLDDLDSGRISKRSVDEIKRLAREKAEDAGSA